MNLPLSQNREWFCFRLLLRRAMHPPAPSLADVVRRPKQVSRRQRSCNAMVPYRRQP
jgi:hypothetical protein